MGMVRLPGAGEATPQRVLEIHGRLLDAGTDVPLHALAGDIWMRLSAQPYNERDDYERLGAVIASSCRPSWNNR
jgi:hypothetical protein